ncbi:OLC1v1004598C1 [Oldenlandia corymbosa var. corymbosa]|uniref:OLC1v1004598C1 n=1 Tax=Oldenlandia corymbosa var. corymbosa TaxID=529605 RepID=A0AAV1DCM8_OLDCO|nr:OLC1v1004598C1 [Oldenlandia corymbosa var. corymbosa]
MGGCQGGYINIWTGFAISRNVRIIDLKIEEHCQARIPVSLYTCRTLESLASNGPFWVSAPSVVRLPKLEELYISLEFYNANEGEPPEVDGKLEIDAPALDFLCCDDHEWKEFSLKKLLFVEEVKLDLNANLNVNGHYIERCNSIARLIEALNHAVLLKLKGTIFEGLSNASTPLSVWFPRLTKLHTEYECCQWSALGAMRGYSVTLEVLKIKKFQCGKDAHMSCWKDPNQVPKSLSQSLTKVSFKDFQGFEDVLGMIRSSIAK